ncbi:sodium:proton antiporter [Bermanella marisrubri]|uniref:Na+/H+ antiporter NhaD and related arsenite Permease n=1 Tax=Bermanella marisrubri TaxID=207949 RepID=Q1N2J2_9GAMM|nr:sodium:proton antiporter NhaD [Bermanella marisrubri]EAT12415.1 Na+/H+ antiporter NhaD and related arsenite Permease [Oceanobacter sp. RED65] [Bermanella marisrubri]QIZ85496.1 sodium:proton antiporter [Bermanella marisrubri]
MADYVSIFIIALSLLGLLAVVFEEVIHVNKAQVVLFLGTLAWLILFMFSGSDIHHQEIITGLSENIEEIAGLWLFLLAAMTFVVYLNKKGLIESIIYRFLPEQISERKLLFLIAIFAYVFSSLADNITATLISIALILSLQLPAKKVLRFATVTVFAVNSGGVAMITGDVTTLMIFLAGKASIVNLLLLSLPAFLAVLVLTTLLSFPMKDQIIIRKKREQHEQVDVAIAIVFLTTILTTIGFNVFFDIPPVLTFLFGLSVMFLLARIYGEDTHNHPIFNYIRQIEFDTLLFFLGILLLVGALKEVEALVAFVGIYDVMPTWLANYTMGILSSLIDNVPLTAALLKSDVTMNPEQWLALTYAVGVGGSLLIIGSAAGIVAMSKIQNLTFLSYLRYFVLLLLAYSIGYSASLLMGIWI